jgi:hypothetical protein
MTLPTDRPFSCPRCQGKAHLLVDSSKIAWVNYYVCHHCGHVWNVSKEDRQGSAVQMTRPNRSVS